MMLRDERYYPSFKQSPLYVRMLAELDMLKEPSYRGSDDGDGESFNGSPTGSINLVRLPHFVLQDLDNTYTFTLEVFPNHVVKRRLVSCDFSLWTTCPTPATMNLCTYMPSSPTQVHRHTHTVSHTLMLGVFFKSVFHFLLEETQSEVLKG